MPFNPLHVAGMGQRGRCPCPRRHPAPANVRTCAKPRRARRAAGPASTEANAAGHASVLEQACEADVAGRGNVVPPRVPVELGTHRRAEDTAEFVRDPWRERSPGGNECSDSGGSPCVLVQTERHPSDSNGLALRPLGLGQHRGGERCRPALAGVDAAQEFVDRGFDRRGQILRTGQAEVVAGLVVDAGEIVHPREIEPHRGQRRPQRENRLEPLCRELRPAKLELDPTEQEQPPGRFRQPAPRLPPVQSRAPRSAQR